MAKKPMIMEDNNKMEAYKQEFIEFMCGTIKVKRIPCRCLIL